MTIAYNNIAYNNIVHRIIGKVAKMLSRLPRSKTAKGFFMSTSGVCVVIASAIILCFYFVASSSPRVSLESLNLRSSVHSDLDFVEPNHWALAQSEAGSNMANFSAMLNASSIAGVCELSINLKCLDEPADPSAEPDSPEAISRCLFGKDAYERLSMGERPCLTGDDNIDRPVFLRILSSMTLSRPSYPEKFALLRSVSSPQYLAGFGLGLASSLMYAEHHGYELYVYVGVPAHFPVAGHFSRIPAIFAALYHRNLDCDLVSYDDLDSIFNPKHINVSVRTLLQDMKSPVAINDEREYCSCSQFYRKDRRAVEFLMLWWEIGHATHCCRSHSFDQIAWWEALSRILESFTSPGTIQTHAEPRQENWPLYYKQIRDSGVESRLANGSNGRWPIYFISGEPHWHGSPWGQDPERSVLYHTGHQRWVQQYPLFRNWTQQTKACVYDGECIHASTPSGGI